MVFGILKNHVNNLFLHHAVLFKKPTLSQINLIKNAKNCFLILVPSFLHTHTQREHIPEFIRARSGIMRYIEFGRKKMSHYCTSRKNIGKKGVQRAV